MHLLLSTRNRDKQREIKALFDERTILHYPEEFFQEDVEETGATLWENALLKAKAGFEKSGLPTFADDTGLEVDALDGAPGVYSSRFAGENVTYAQNVDKLLQELKSVPLLNRTARFRTVIAYVDDTQELRFDGVLEGSILTSREGENGFGYDPVFRPEGLEMTLAQMSLGEKNQISHRGRALAKFITWWHENFK